jgi:SPP1 gp7 family putative phage head morphogenesis protein
MAKRETQAERRARQRAEEDARREEGFAKARNAERSYGAQLRSLARHVARIIQAYAPEAEDEPIAPPAMARIEAALSAYAKAVTPWARATAARMIREVHRRDLSAWEKYTRGMSTALRVELNQTPIGEAMAQLLNEQVDLITSLPLEASQHVQEKAQEALYTSARYPERTAEIEAALAEAHPRATEAWLRNRATTIARTETARTASVLIQSRAEHVGADSYIWKTAGDWKVRPSHRKLSNTVHRWDDPPLSDPPDYHSHPGQIFNCRCVALPILP